ncbi:hypothetical protein SUGI_1343040 [Cryptomeria japonica]|uniref:Uncharacterized protein n=1 Tax=Cryptomeria japonica TaxID=3369 RepID=A0AAD3NRR2_CRYJA|nr:hypothetical protein SUGI_1343040 [Cryptomeria japonica]
MSHNVQLTTKIDYMNVLPYNRDDGSNVVSIQQHDTIRDHGHESNDATCTCYTNLFVGDVEIMFDNPYENVFQSANDDDDSTSCASADAYARLGELVPAYGATSSWDGSTFDHSNVLTSYPLLDMKDDIHSIDMGDEGHSVTSCVSDFSHTPASSPN